MLSYRHAFHAGNHADVIKHSLLIQVLRYLLQKDKPLRIIDTHAGAGCYAFDSAEARKNREFATGIGQLWTRQDLPPALADYVSLVRGFNPDGHLRHYPGSPLIMQALMRPQDRLFAHELHSTDHRLLSEALGPDPRVKTSDEDGLAALKGLVPPPDRRAMTLMDPSYEIKSDYTRVVQAIEAAHRRFATGCYLLWYPVVLRARIEELERALVKSGIRSIQQFELGVAPDSLESGMTASGMIVINPPWNLWQTMAECLPWLTANLGGSQGYHRQEHLVPE